MMKARLLNQCRSASRNILNKRHYATPLTDALTMEPAKPLLADGSLQVSTLDNGVTIASVDTGGSVSRVSVVVHSGSRHESAGSEGITHLARNAAFVSTGSHSAFRIVREVQQYGASLESAHSRELMTRQATFLRNNLSPVLENITTTLLPAQVAPWELSEVKQATLQQNASLDDVAGHLELLHKAAYRTGLGNSMYCSDINLGISPYDLETFTEKAYVGSKISIVGTDVEHGDLTNLVADMLSGLEYGQPTNAVAQKYAGDELRTHTSKDMAHVSIVGHSAGLSSPDAAVFGVLQNIMGGSTSGLKWGVNSSRLHSAAQGVTNGSPMLINTMNLAYSDSGLFGFHIIAKPDIAGSVAKASLSQLSDVAAGNVSAEEIEKAKTQLIASLANDAQADLHQDIAIQLALSGSVTSATDSASAIAKVSAEDIVRAATQISSGKLSMASSGNVSHVPYLDEL